MSMPKTIFAIIRRNPVRLQIKVLNITIFQCFCLITSTSYKALHHQVCGYFEWQKLFNVEKKSCTWYHVTYYLNDGIKFQSDFEFDIQLIFSRV